MRFNYIYYGTEELEFKNRVVIALEGNKPSSKNIISYRINALEYSVDNETNEIVIDDEYLDRIKSKVLKDQIKASPRLKNINFNNFEVEYYFFFKENYFIAPESYLCDDDVKLTISEFLIKSILE